MVFQLVFNLLIAFSANLEGSIFEMKPADLARQEPP